MRKEELAGRFCFALGRHKICSPTDKRRFREVMRNWPFFVHGCISLELALNCSDN